MNERAVKERTARPAVSDSILNKPGKLTPEEYAEVQTHPLHGTRILGNIQSATVKAVLPRVRYHHERWDDTGYPEGLTAENIQILGRLPGVADFCDALTSARAYRAAMPARDAIELVRQGGDRHFDPPVAAALVRLFERGEVDLDAMRSEMRQILPARAAACSPRSRCCSRCRSTGARCTRISAPIARPSVRSAA